MDPTFITQNEPPNVLGNAICWTAQMAVSANLRYQLLGGADQVQGCYNGVIRRHLLFCGAGGGMIG